MGDKPTLKWVRNQHTGRWHSEIAGIPLCVVYDNGGWEVEADIDDNTFVISDTLHATERQARDAAYNDLILHLRDLRDVAWEKLCALGVASKMSYGRAAAHTETNIPR